MQEIELGKGLLPHVTAQIASGSSPVLRRLCRWLNGGRGAGSSTSLLFSLFFSHVPRASCVEEFIADGMQCKGKGKREVLCRYMRVWRQSCVDA